MTAPSTLYSGGFLLAGKKGEEIGVSSVVGRRHQRGRHKREGICSNDLTSRWFIYSKTLCTIAGGGTIVTF